jgi:NADH dehydrogenase
MSGAPHRVVIVGGGFAGLNAAQRLADARGVDVTLIDRRNFHLFQPLLYQVATGTLSPGDISAPLRAVLGRQRNATVLLGEMADLDVAAGQVLLLDGTVPYDTLIVATGASHHYFGHDEWAEHAPGLKTIEDATEIRRRIFVAYENAERERDPEQRKAFLTFVVIGAGPTGVEMAGALAEISRATLARDFRTIDPASARIILVEGLDRVLPTYHADLWEPARAQLRRLGVEVWTGTRVTGVDAEGVSLGSDRIAARTVIWAAGVQASPVAKTLGVPLDRVGRVLVEPDLSIPGHPEVFVAGDLAAAVSEGKPVPGVSPAALQAGARVAADSPLLPDRVQEQTHRGVRLGVLVPHAPPGCTTHHRDRTLRRAAIGCIALVFSASAAAQEPVCRGRTIGAWIAAIEDLDPEFRAEAVACLNRFGPTAVASLAAVLDRDGSRETQATATALLLRSGPVGRSIVSRRLATASGRTLASVIDGVGRETAWGRLFVPHLRTLSARADVSLLVLRVLATLEVDAPPASSPSEPEPLVGDVAGLRVTLPVRDCVPAGVVTAVRFEIRGSGGLSRPPRLYFRTALADDADEWYNESRPAPGGETSGGARVFEARLPKPFVGATAITYWVEAETTGGALRTDAVVAAVAANTVACETLGARALPPSSDPRPIEVLKGPKRR